MRIRLNPRGHITENINHLFDLIGGAKFFEAISVLSKLHANLAKYYQTRNIDMKPIDEHLVGMLLNFNSALPNTMFKQHVLYEEMKELIRLLNSMEKKPEGKYELLLQLYEDLVSDVEQLAKYKRVEDTEAIREDFKEIRAMENEFMTDWGEYKLYQEVVKQIGLATGALMRLSYDKVTTATEMNKIHRTLENLFPKIESLIASKVFREEPSSKEEEETLSDDKVKEIKDLSECQGMNAEEISKYTGINQDIVESVLFEVK